MKLRFRDAKPDDAPAIAGLQNAVAGALTAQYGAGPWSGLTSERGVLGGLRYSRMRVGVSARHIMTVLRLAPKKPWAIDVAYFTPVKRPLYLTGMAVSVAHQRSGLGRQALDDALRITRDWPAHAIRLDAYDADAGAGEFYAKCGYSKRGQVVYKGCPLVYYETVLSGSETT
jgi:GNAT superfamily N-acetyltransferase